MRQHVLGAVALGAVLLSGMEWAAAAPAPAMTTTPSKATSHPSRHHHRDRQAAAHQIKPKRQAQDRHRPAVPTTADANGAPSSQNPH